MNNVIGISCSDYEQFGCPVCGYSLGRKFLRVYGASRNFCDNPDCGVDFVVLPNGIDTAPFSVIDKNGTSFTPELQEHPRKGTPAHGNTDDKTYYKYELFNSRGIGLDHCTCFVCGTSKRSNDESSSEYLNNIAAFVSSKEAGERVVGMFEMGARLDFRYYEPNWIQVKVGSCDEHLPNLKKLNELVSDGTINMDKIKIARNK